MSNVATIAAPLLFMLVSFLSFVFLQKSEFEEFWASRRHTPLEARNTIVASLCPQVFGLYVVKLSVCLALIGGVEVSGGTVNIVM